MSEQPPSTRMPTIRVAAAEVPAPTPRSVAVIDVVPLVPSTPFPERRQSTDNSGTGSHRSAEVSDNRSASGFRQLSGPPWTPSPTILAKIVVVVLVAPIHRICCFADEDGLGLRSGPRCVIAPARFASELSIDLRNHTTTTIYI